MRHTRSMAVTLMLAASLAGGAVAYAAEPPDAQSAQAGRHYQNWQQRFQQRLGLTDQQMQQLQAIHQRNAQTTRQHFQALRKAQAELRRLVLIDADQASIAAKQAEVQQLMAQSVEMRVNTLKEITPILTPEQREKYAQMGERGHTRSRDRKAS